MPNFLSFPIFRCHSSYPQVPDRQKGVPEGSITTWCSNSFYHVFIFSCQFCHHLHFVQCLVSFHVNWFILYCNNSFKQLNIFTYNLSCLLFIYFVMKEADCWYITAISPNIPGHGWIFSFTGSEKWVEWGSSMLSWEKQYLLYQALFVYDSYKIQISYRTCAILLRKSGIIIE